MSAVEHTQPTAPASPTPAFALTIVDARFPSGSAQALAWNVVPQGPRDLSTWLCRDADGTYFLLCRAATRSTLPDAIVPLTAARAAAWFDGHPAHFADWHALD